MARVSSNAFHAWAEKPFGSIIGISFATEYRTEQRVLELQL